MPVCLTRSPSDSFDHCGTDVLYILLQVQVHCLTGHDDTVASILTQSTDPQVTSHLMSTMCSGCLAGAQHATAERLSN